VCMCGGFAPIHPKPIKTSRVLLECTLCSSDQTPPAPARARFQASRINPIQQSCDRPSIHPSFRATLPTRACPDYDLTCSSLFACDLDLEHTYMISKGCWSDTGSGFSACRVLHPILAVSECVFVVVRSKQTSVSLVLAIVWVCRGGVLVGWVAHPRL
jgi:hypothetical protein